MIKGPAEKPVRSNIFEVVPAPADLPKNVLQKNFEKVRRNCPSGEGFVEVGIADLFINWCRKNSLWYLYYATACCGIELMQGGASKYDFDRFGAVFRATPRQADMLMTCGTITHKMAERVQRLYAQMAEPKWVIAIGACTITGGPFYKDSYCVVKGVDLILPKVDVYVPGCPPRPEAFIEAIRNLQELIMKTKNYGYKPGQAEKA
jgi:NADH-quinone oxidoreductase subunit B